MVGVVQATSRKGPIATQWNVQLEGKIGCVCGLVQSRRVSWFAEARFWVDGGCEETELPFFAKFVLTRSCTPAPSRKFDAELDPPGAERDLARDQPDSKGAAAQCGRAYLGMQSMSHTVRVSKWQPRLVFGQACSGMDGCLLLFFFKSSFIFLSFQVVSTIPTEFSSNVDKKQ